MKIILNHILAYFIHIQKKKFISSITMIIFLSDFLFSTHDSQQITVVEICEIANHSSNLVSIAQ